MTGMIFRLVMLVLGWFMDPERSNRIRKTGLLNRLKKLEAAHALAWAEGAPMKASKIARQLRDLRERIRYVEAT